MEEKTRYLEMIQGVISRMVSSGELRAELLAN